MFKLKVTSKEYLSQNAIGLAVLILVGLVLWPLAPKPSTNVSGIFLPNGNSAMAPIPAATVQVLEAMPPHAEVLGTISTKIYYGTLSQAEETLDMNASINYAKSLAAEHGANAIVINLLTSGMTMGQGPLNGFIMQSSAVSL